MVTEFKDDAPDNTPNRGVRGAWVVFKDTLKSAIKWAAIGALVLAAVSMPFGGVTALLESVPLVGTHILAPLAEMAGWGAKDWLLGGLTTGAMIGGIAGGVIGLGRSISGIDDTLDDLEAQDTAKANRARQLAMQKEMLAMNMQRLQAGSMQLAGNVQAPGYNPNMPNMQQNMGRGAPN